MKTYLLFFIVNIFAKNQITRNKALLSFRLVRLVSAEKTGPVPRLSIKGKFRFLLVMD